MVATLLLSITIKEDLVSVTMGPLILILVATLMVAIHVAIPLLLITIKADPGTMLTLVPLTMLVRFFKVLVIPVTMDRINLITQVLSTAMEATQMVDSLRLLLTMAILVAMVLIGLT